jgi:hypothetical protein
MRIKDYLGNMGKIIFNLIYNKSKKKKIFLRSKYIFSW